jgi:U4/U6.U5 tri-snRNP-associated protein 2
MYVSIFFRKQRGISLIEILDLDNPDSAGSTVYDLVANITHSSTAGTAREDTTWKVHVHTRPGESTEERWFQIQDLIVEEIQRQMVFLGESYIQVRFFGPYAWEH